MSLSPWALMMEWMISYWTRSMMVMMVSSGMGREYLPKIRVVGVFGTRSWRGSRGPGSGFGIGVLGWMNVIRRRKKAGRRRITLMSSLSLLFHLHCAGQQETELRALRSRGSREREGKTSFEMVISYFGILVLHTCNSGITQDNDKPRKQVRFYAPQEIIFKHFRVFLGKSHALRRVEDATCGGAKRRWMKGKSRSTARGCRFWACSWKKRVLCLE